MITYYSPVPINDDNRPDGVILAITQSQAAYDHGKPLERETLNGKKYFAEIMALKPLAQSEIDRLHLFTD